MKQEVAKAWVEALRSGQYQQGTGALRAEGGGYCCLGVLCDLSKLGTWSGTRYCTTTEPWTYVLPSEVRLWAGMYTNEADLGKGEVPYRMAENEIYTLAAANDKGFTFTEIADYIERNWEHL